jgi:hypothetical protein
MPFLACWGTHLVRRIVPELLYLHGRQELRSSTMDGTVPSAMERDRSRGVREVVFFMERKKGRRQPGRSELLCGGRPAPWSQLGDVAPCWASDPHLMAWETAAMAIRWSIYLLFESST